MGKGGVAVAAQKKRDESYTVAEEAPSGSLKRVSRHSQAIQTYLVPESTPYLN